MRLRLPLVLAVVALLATGCGSNGSNGSGGSAEKPSPSPAPTEEVTGEEALTGDWVLSAGTGIEPSDEFPVTLTFPVEKGLLAGSSACNRYNAAPTFDGATFTLGPVASTRRMCEPAAMKIEGTYLAALEDVDTATRDGDDLLLSGGDVELRFVPAP